MWQYPDYKNNKKKEKKRKEEKSKHIWLEGEGDESQALPGALVCLCLCCLKTGSHYGLRDPPASAFQLAGIQACVTTGS